MIVARDEQQLAWRIHTRALVCLKDAALEPMSGSDVFTKNLASDHHDDSTPTGLILLQSTYTVRRSISRILIMKNGDLPVGTSNLSIFGFLQQFVVK